MPVIQEKMAKTEERFSDEVTPITKPGTMLSREPGIMYPIPTTVFSPLEDMSSLGGFSKTETPVKRKVIVLSKIRN